jgi:hypothetical protein
MSDEPNELMPTNTMREEASMEEKEIVERLHAVEVAQATGTATLAGAQATQAAAQAGTTATTAAMQAGNVAMMAAGSLGLVAGIFIGLAIRSAR